MDWRAWEDEQIRAHRFYSNDELATLILPHRTPHGVEKRRRSINAPMIVHCKRCGVETPPRNQYHICEKCVRSPVELGTTIQSRYSVYKKSAKQRGIEWKLTLNDFVKHWNSHCYYCNDKIDGIGIDRVNSKLGYTLSNIQPCCYTCNIMKGKLSTKDWFEKMNKIINNEAKDGESTNPKA